MPVLPPETCPCTTAPRGPSSTSPHRLSRATARRIGTAAGSRSGRLLIAVSAVLSLGPAGYAALGPGAPRADNHQAAGATAGRDTTTPNTRLVARFPTRNGAAFLVSADEPASFACSLDGAAYAPAPRPRASRTSSPAGTPSRSWRSTSPATLTRHRPRCGGTRAAVTDRRRRWTASPRLGRVRHCTRNDAGRGDAAVRPALSRAATSTPSARSRRPGGCQLQRGGTRPWRRTVEAAQHRDKDRSGRSTRGTSATTCETWHPLAAPGPDQALDRKVRRRRRAGPAPNWANSGRSAMRVLWTKDRKSRTPGPPRVVRAPPMCRTHRDRGAGGNRTRVLERRTRSSPGAVREVAFLGPGAGTDTCADGLSQEKVPINPPDRS